MSPTRRNKTISAGKPVHASSKFFGWARGALLVAGGAVFGFFTNYYVDYRSDYRQSLDAQMDAFEEVAAPVADNLRGFFLVAQGQREKSASDVEALRSSLYDSVTAAQLLADRIGKNDLLQDYQAASVSLQRASQIVTGPLDAEPLMEAVNDFLLAEQRLQTAAQDSYKILL